jgi:hypothetical protein
MSSLESDKVESLVEEGQSHGRKEKRTYELYKNTNEDLKLDWADLANIIKVLRVREIKGIRSYETAYFITNKLCNLQVLAKAIRNHWLIENSLHWVKDVTFFEDKTRHKEVVIAENKSVFINCAINILRANENRYLKRTMRLCCNNINRLMAMLE